MAQIKSQTIISQMHEIAETITAEDLAGLRISSEKTLYTESRSKSPKKKNFAPPADYAAVEALIDLRQHIAEGEYREAFPAYLYLKRIMAC